MFNPLEYGWLGVHAVIGVVSIDHEMKSSMKSGEVSMDDVVRNRRAQYIRFMVIRAVWMEINGHLYC